MPADDAYHRFSMLQRAVRNFAKRGAFDQAIRLYQELLDTDFGEARYSKLKWRFAAELAKDALVLEKRDVAEEIVAAAEARIPASDLDASDRDVMVRVRSGLASL